MKDTTTGRHIVVAKRDFNKMQVICENRRLRLKRECVYDLEEFWDTRNIKDLWNIISNSVMGRKTDMPPVLDKDTQEVETHSNFKSPPQDSQRDKEDEVCRDKMMDARCDTGSTKYPIQDKTIHMEDEYVDSHNAKIPVIKEHKPDKDLDDTVWLSSFNFHPQYNTEQMAKIAKVELESPGDTESLGDMEGCKAEDTRNRHCKEFTGGSGLAQGAGQRAVCLWSCLVPSLAGLSKKGFCRVVPIMERGYVDWDEVELGKEVLAAKVELEDQGEAEDALQLNVPATYQGPEEREPIILDKCNTKHISQRAEVLFIGNVAVVEMKEEHKLEDTMVG